MAFSGDSSVRRLTNKDDPRRAAKEYNQRERENSDGIIAAASAGSRGIFLSRATRCCWMRIWAKASASRNGHVAVDQFRKVAHRVFTLII